MNAEGFESEGWQRWPELSRLDSARVGSPQMRRAALVAAAEAVCERFVEGRVEALSSHTLVSFPYPSKYALRDALEAPWPYVCLTNRVFIVKYLDFQGKRRVLVVSPSDVDRNGETPFFKGLIERFGAARGVAEKVISKRGVTVSEALA
ncbi:MAG TPA: hypothetical protein PK095_15755, partial [Myxococcota bacterium]|nr:hypothetical protein [Myxococcota bacterium]